MAMFMCSDDFPSSSEVLDPPSSPDHLSDQADVHVSMQTEVSTPPSTTGNVETPATHTDEDECKTTVHIHKQLHVHVYVQKV